MENLLMLLNKINVGEIKVEVKKENPSDYEGLDEEDLKDIDFDKSYVQKIFDENGKNVIDDVTNLIEEVLIASDGSCNWNNISQVRTAGFKVYAGDSDSFGWLIGCLETNKGVIVYG